MFDAFERVPRAHATQATDIYLEWLSQRVFESQVISGLAVLLCTPFGSLPPFSRVISHINKPSILADVLLQQIYGWGKRKGGWQGAHSGLAPETFSPEKYFNKHKAAHVPPIFSNDLEQLEARSGLPLMRQWAYEWRNLMDATGSPYSDYPYRFVDVGLRRSGINGQLSQTQCDVYRSAHLRVLAFAVTEWGMTIREACFLSSPSVPLNQELLKVKPIQRPSWLSDIPERCCEAGAPIETLAQELIKPNLGSTGMRPVNLEIPIDANLFEFGDLSVSAVLVSDDFVPDPEGDYVSAATGWVLSDGISFAGQMDEVDPSKFASAGLSGSSLPVSVSVWPLPSGFWHNDYYHLGISLPASFHFSDPPDIVCNENNISLVSDGAFVGKLSIWHDHWTPTYPERGNTRCGMLTELRESDLALSSKKHGMNLGWFVKLRLWQRKTDYDDFELTERRKFFRDAV